MAVRKVESKNIAIHIINTTSNTYIDNGVSSSNPPHSLTLTSTTREKKRKILMPYLWLKVWKETYVWRKYIVKTKTKTIGSIKSGRNLSMPPSHILNGIYSTDENPMDVINGTFQKKETKRNKQVQNVKTK